MSPATPVRGRSRLLAATAVAGLGLTLIPSTASAAVTERESTTPVQVVSGSKAVRSTWTVSNTTGVDADRRCDGSEGLGLQDAGREGTDRDRGDAFDNGLMFEVGGERLVAPATWTVESQRVATDDVVDRAVTVGPMEAAGLRNVVQYRALRNSQMLRSTLRMTNAGDTAVRVPVSVATNVGSDSTSTVRGSSSGDAALTSADRWVVTSDTYRLDGDPVNLHALAGPGKVSTPVETTTDSVFDCAGAEGVGATYQLRIPAGQSRTLMLFNRLAPTARKALRMAERFDKTPRSKSALVADLTRKQRASVVNWNLR